MPIPDFIRRNAILQNHTTLGVGGRASFFADVKSEDDLVVAYKFARDEGLDVFVLGQGSNILFSDHGFDGLVLRMKLKRMHYKDEKFWAEAGVPVSSVVSLCENGCTGYECFAGLPGTVGGAVYGNAGCYGGQFWDAVMAVRFFNGETFEIVQAAPDMFNYRWSFFKENSSNVIVSIQLKVEPKDSNLVIAETRRIRELRRSKQPKEKSAGCIFKNPIISGQESHAGELIDKTGIKGTIVGQARISDVHGNYFVNLGGAKAEDFLKLINLARSRVFEKFRMLLQEEIIRVGEF